MKKKQKHSCRCTVWGIPLRTCRQIIIMSFACSKNSAPYRLLRTLNLPSQYLHYYLLCRTNSSFVHHSLFCFGPWFRFAKSWGKIISWSPGCFVPGAKLGESKKHGLKPAGCAETDLDATSSEQGDVALADVVLVVCGQPLWTIGNSVAKLIPKYMET